MRYYLPYISLIVFISVSTSSCKKDPPIEVQKEEKSVVQEESNWIPYDALQYQEKLLINSYSDGNSIGFLSAYNSISLNEQGEIIRHLNPYVLPVEAKTPINNEVYISNVGSIVNIVRYKTSSAYYLNIKSLDSTYYETLPFVIGERFGLSNSFCLIPYRTGFDINSKVRLLLIKYKINPDPFLAPIIDTVFTRKIDLLEIGIYYAAIQNLGFFDGKFFVSKWGNNGGVWAIDTNGIVTPTLPWNIRKIVKQENLLYCFSDYNGLFVSYNLGDSWNKVMDNLNPDFNYMEYTYIDDKIIAYGGQSQLFVVSFLNNKMVVKELKNEGLNGNQITSISLCKDLVYVTTLSGAFYKKKSDFFQYK